MTTRSRLLFLGMMGLGVLIGVLISAGLQQALSPTPVLQEGGPTGGQVSRNRAPADRPDLDPEERHTIALFKDASRSVAYITTQVEQATW
jgi:hypothetical protein